MKRRDWIGWRAVDVGFDIKGFPVGGWRRCWLMKLTCSPKVLGYGAGIPPRLLQCTTTIDNGPLFPAFLDDR